MDPQFLLDRLTNPRSNGSGWTAKCPAHEDDQPSLSIHESDNRLLVHCHAGCQTSDILKSLDLKWDALFEERLEPSRIPVAEYEYRDIEGKLIYVVERYEPKTFKQRRYTTQGGWEWNMDGVDRLLYRLPQVTKAVSDGRWVFLVEGEKDVHTLESYGLVATTSSGGASGWRSELANYLEGGKVAIIPDCDESGLKYAEKAAASLSDIASEVRIVHLPGLPPKGDVSVFLNGHGGTIDQIKRMVHDSVPWMPGPVMKLDRVTARNINWLWDGKIPMNKFTIIAGQQGSGKSYLTLKILSELSTGGHLPDSEGMLTPAESLVITFEDDPHDTIRPRAEQCHADLGKIHVWDAAINGFSFESLQAYIRKNPAISTIVLDPTISVLGADIDAYRESDVRSRLARFLGLGRTVIGIMHLTKTERDSLVYRVGGSSGFTAVARSVLLVENDSVRVIKSNVARLGQSVKFGVDESGFRWKTYT